MPAAMWEALTSHIEDVPMTVTVRGAVLSGGVLSGKPALGTSGVIRIAPASAAGAIVYWQTDTATNTGRLKGFSPGDESVVLALQTDQIAVKPGGQSVTCIGCHTSTPDGQFAAFKTLLGTNGGAIASVVQGATGAAPKFWTTASINAMNTSAFGIPTFSKAHWKPGGLHAAHLPRKRTAREARVVRSGGHEQRRGDGVWVPRARRR